MRVAKYLRADRTTFEVEYDENAPCRICGLPVVAASMGGTDVCPWCDCGIYRDGTRWGPEGLSKARAAEIDLQLRNTSDLRFDTSYPMSELRQY
jgi:uncharacterized Zn finger protein (UPF0148 family)